MKPYAVKVTIQEKISTKEFDTKEELEAFLLKAEEVKKKAPSLLVEIIRQPEIIDDPREESLAWVAIMENGVRKKDSYGKFLYRSVPVPQKPKVMYCPYCMAYKDFKQISLGYGQLVKGCPDCGMTVLDFHVKTVNNLWKVKG